MKQIVIKTNPIEKIDGSTVAFSTATPIGLDTGICKYLVVELKDGAFGLKSITNLNLLRELAGYDTLMDLIAAETKNGKELFLFDNWLEFYRWCAE